MLGTFLKRLWHSARFCRDSWQSTGDRRVWMRRRSGNDLESLGASPSSLPCAACSDALRQFLPFWRS